MGRLHDSKNTTMVSDFATSVDVLDAGTVMEGAKQSIGGITYVLEQMYFISYQVCLILLVVEFCNTLSNNRLVCCIVSQLSFKEGPTKTTSRPRPIMFHLVPT